MILASLNNNERNRLEQRLFICPYCPKLKTTSEIEYQRNIVLEHPGNISARVQFDNAAFNFCTHF
jgi:hypothetical protein